MFQLFVDGSWDGPGTAGPGLLNVTNQVSDWAQETGALHEAFLVAFGQTVFLGPHYSLSFCPFLYGYRGRTGLPSAWDSSLDP